jgi:predicted nucleic acid-binding Zn ribbon protein
MLVTRKNIKFIREKMSVLYKYEKEDTHTRHKWVRRIEINSYTTYFVCNGRSKYELSSAELK